MKFVQDMIDDVDMVIDTFKLDQKTVDKKDVSKKEEGTKANITYLDYSNSRFGFSFQYPEDLTMDPPPDNGDGVVLHSVDFEVIAYGGHTNIINFDETIEDYYYEDINNIEDIAYQKLTKDWYVLSYEE